MQTRHKVIREYKKLEGLTVLKVVEEKDSILMIFPNLITAVFFPQDYYTYHDCNPMALELVVVDN